MKKEDAIQTIKAYTKLLEEARKSAEEHREGDGKRVHCLYLDDKGDIQAGYYYMGTMYNESLKGEFWKKYC